MPNIFDNITDATRLGPALRDSLTDFDTVDVATGYFDLRGWSSLASLIDALVEREMATVPGPDRLHSLHCFTLLPR